MIIPDLLLEHSHIILVVMIPLPFLLLFCLVKYTSLAGLISQEMHEGEYRGCKFIVFPDYAVITSPLPNGTRELYSWHNLSVKAEEHDLIDKAIPIDKKIEIIHNIIDRAYQHTPRK